MRPPNILLIDLVTQTVLVLAQVLLQITLWKKAKRLGWTVAQRVALGLVYLLLDTYLFLGITVATTLYTIPFTIPPRLHVFFLVPANLWLFGCAGSYYAYAAFRFFTKLLWPAENAGQPANPGRRHAIQALGYAVVAAPAVTLALGAAIGRTDFHVREVAVSVAGLHPDLDGLRMVQISDLHLGDFLTERELARAIDAANGLRGHFGLVTGDLITKLGDPLPTAIRQLARFKTDAGVYGCMGNHEIYAGSEWLTEQLAARHGIRFLRMGNQVLRFGQGQFNLAGVDFQSSLHKDAYLEGTENLIVEGMPNFLLSHNPDVFPAAIAKGFDVTFSGHTHGGQVTMEILTQTVNFARFYTPYVSGLYTRGGKSLYVTRGIGTIGVPARVGALPEITLIKLRRA